MREREILNKLKKKGTRPIHCFQCGSEEERERDGRHGYD
jgi:hypothetical protein